MSEVSDRQLRIEAVLAALDSLEKEDAHDVPEWVAQELTFSQMRLLFLLSKHGPAPMSRIAEWLGVGLPTASGAVERVERHGLVARQHRLDDRRVVECQLTDAGRRLIDQISGSRVEILQRIFRVLTDDELSQMSQLITTMVARLGAEAAAVSTPNKSPDVRVDTNEEGASPA
jgi:DNA-binding MarR family transcriptional regulator